MSNQTKHISRLINSKQYKKLERFFDYNKILLCNEYNLEDIYFFLSKTIDNNDSFCYNIISNNYLKSKNKDNCIDINEYLLFYLSSRRKHINYNDNDDEKIICDCLKSIVNIDFTIDIFIYASKFLFDETISKKEHNFYVYSLIPGPRIEFHDFLFDWVPSAMAENDKIFFEMLLLNTDKNNFRESLNYKDTNGYSMLHYLVKRNKYSLLNILIKK